MSEEAIGKLDLLKAACPLKAKKRHTGDDSKRRDIPAGDLGVRPPLARITEQLVCVQNYAESSPTFDSFLPGIRQAAEGALIAEGGAGLGGAAAAANGFLFAAILAAVLGANSQTVPISQETIDDAKNLDPAKDDQSGNQKPDDSKSTKEGSKTTTSTSSSASACPMFSDFSFAASMFSFPAMMPKPTAGGQTTKSSMPPLPTISTKCVSFSYNGCTAVAHEVTGTTACPTTTQALPASCKTTGSASTVSSPIRREILLLILLDGYKRIQSTSCSTEASSYLS